VELAEIRRYPAPLGAEIAEFAEPELVLPDPAWTRSDIPSAKDRDPVKKRRLRRISTKDSVLLVRRTDVYNGQRQVREVQKD
jgi:hypothetical protein